MIDSLIQGALIGVAVLILAAMGFSFRFTGFGRSRAPDVWLLAILIFVYFLLMYGYFIFFEAVWNGQTPGKRLTHIRVMKDTGQPITPIESVARNLIRIIDQVPPPTYGIGLLCAWISPRSKRLGDYVAGTVVVHERPFETNEAQWDAPAQQNTHHYGASRLTLEEMALVEAFLSRRSALEAAVRYDTAAGIVSRIESKLTLPADRPTAEKILEGLSYERRSTAAYR